MSMKNAETILTSSQAAAYCGGVLRGADAEITGFAIDSRAVRPGDMFVALKGENTDGHKYIQNAYDAGAVCVLCETEANGSCIIVDDSLKALQKIGSGYLKTIDPTVFAVTGSVGKTTTKQFISSALSARFITQKTEGNYNSTIGLPLTLLNTKTDCQALVLEMGMSAPGEISTMSALAQPYAAVITNIGSSHLEMLGTRENILRAKLEITRGLRRGGALIMNGDDRLLWGQRDAFDGKFRVLYYALYNPEADYIAENINFTDGALSFDLRRADGTRTLGITAPTVGMHNVYNASAAYICGELAGMDEDEIKKGISAFSNTGYRQKIYNIGNYTIFADCYNASPESMKASLSVLKETAEKHGGRAVAVLGEMRELGAASQQLHRQVGEAAYESGVKLLITNKTPALMINEGAIQAGMKEDDTVKIPDTADAEQTAQMIASACLPGDIILFKASRAVALENVITEFEKIIQQENR